MKKVLTTLLCVLVLIAILPGSVAAAQITPVVVVPETEIAVDQTTGAFRFTMELMTEKPYAGAEFGLICSQGVQITAVSAADGTVTGPQAANGLIWFGYFAGEDSFSDTNTLTIEGTCEIGREGAVIIRDARQYTAHQIQHGPDALGGPLRGIECPAPKDTAGVRLAPGDDAVRLVEAVGPPDLRDVETFHAQHRFPLVPRHVQSQCPAFGVVPDEIADGRLHLTRPGPGPPPP